MYIHMKSAKPSCFMPYFATIAQNNNEFGTQWTQTRHLLAEGGSDVTILRRTK